MDATLKSRLIDGLNYYKNGDLTLEGTLNGFEKLIGEFGGRLKPQTDIEKQESIVAILSQLLDEIEQDDRIIKYRKIGESTAWERIAIHNALEKLLALDNLKIIPIE